MTTTRTRTVEIKNHGGDRGRDIDRDITTSTSTSSSSRMLFTKAIIAGSASSSFCFVRLCLDYVTSPSPFPAFPAFPAFPFPSFVDLGDFDYDCIAGKVGSILDQLQPFAQSITFCWLIMSWFSLMRNLDLDEDNEEEDVSSTTSSSEENNSNKKKSNESSTSTNKSSSRSTTTKRRRRRRRRRKVLLLSSATLLCLSLMFAPEGLRMMNNNKMDLLSADYNDNGNNNGNNNSNNNNNNKIIKLDYKVDNMDCGGCVRSVEAILSKQIGVVSAKVLSLDLGEVEVYLNKELVGDNYEKKEFDKILNDALMLKGYELHER